MVRIALMTLACVVVSGMLACNGVAGPQIVGSGEIKSEPRDVGEFSRVRTQVSADITVQVGGKQSVTVETDDNLLPIVLTRIDGDVLEITTDQSFSTRKGIKVTITVPDLKSAEVNSSGDITVHGVKTDAFNVHIRGSGDVKLDGTCGELGVKIDGSGDVDATKLQAADAKVSINGSGDVKVNASKSLDARINGSGDIRYAGNPSQVQRQINGGGNIKPM